MEEPLRRDPLNGVLIALAFLCFGGYLALAALDSVSWDYWWAVMFMSMGIPLVIELPIRYASPRYRVHGLVFTRQLLGVILLCFGISGAFDFPEWSLALVFLAIGWAILTFSLWRYSTPKQRR